MTEDKYKVIGIYQNPHRAYILRDRLIIEGVDAWVTDENTIMNNPFYSDELGGAKLNVKIEDVKKAEEILDILGSTQNN